MTLLIGFRNFLILEQSLLEPPETSGNLWELLRFSENPVDDFITRM